MTGYQLIAIDSTGQVIATYAEATDGMAALRRCVEEFPPSEGYAGHYAEDDLGFVYQYSKHNPDVILGHGYVERKLREIYAEEDLPGLPLD